ncbi:hypothetical protein ACQY0O_002282 [Thecaphora frezii]
MFAPVPARLESFHHSESFRSELVYPSLPTLSETMNHAYGARAGASEPSGWNRPQDERATAFFATPRAADNGRILPPASSLVPGTSSYPAAGSSASHASLNTGYSSSMESSGRSYSVGSHHSPLTEQQQFPMHQNTMSPSVGLGGDSFYSTHARSATANLGPSMHGTHPMTQSATHLGSHSHQIHPLYLQPHQAQAQSFRPYEASGSYPAMQSYGGAVSNPMHPYSHSAPSFEYRSHYFNPFEVKHRRRTTKSQFHVLEGTFQEIPKPNAALRKALSVQLDMPPRAVQIWFQNRRAKAKALAKKEAANKEAEASGSGTGDIKPTPETEAGASTDEKRPQSDGRFPHSQSDLSLSSSNSMLSNYHAQGSTSPSASDDGQASGPSQYGQTSSDSGFFKMPLQQLPRDAVSRPSSSVASHAFQERGRYGTGAGGSSSSSNSNSNGTSHHLEGSWMNREAMQTSSDGQGSQSMHGRMHDVSFGVGMGMSRQAYHGEHDGASGPAESASSYHQYEAGQGSHARRPSFHTPGNERVGLHHAAGASSSHAHAHTQQHAGSTNAPLYASGLPTGLADASPSTAAAAAAAASNSLKHEPANGSLSTAQSLFPDDCSHERRASCPDNVPHLATNLAPSSSPNFVQSSLTSANQQAGRSQW